MNRCIITGCALYSLWEKKWTWGDLHEVGDSTYVFNASGNSWNYDPVDDGCRKVSVKDYYEKNNIMVFPKDEATLNLRAEEYIGEQK